MNEFMTIAEVAALLKCSKPTVMRAVNEAGLPAFRLGPRTVRFSRAEVEAWAQKRGPRKGTSDGRRTA
jgi:excisionase family DNA binding protein